MRENERRRILDEVAEAVHRGAPLDSYQDQVDRLVDEAEMSLDAIEAEVNDRISRIQTDEEIDNLRSSVKKKGLLIGGATAAALLLLSLVGSYLLMQSMLPASEPTPAPTATRAPVAIAVQPAGHWLFSIETREVQPAAGDPTQAIVTVHVIGKDGNPAPDGLEARFSVTSGDITPRTSTVRSGVLTALHTATPGAPPATLSVTVQNDTASHQMPAFGPGGVAQEQTPIQTPTPEVTPSPTPVTPTPTPEPVEITWDWSPRWVSDTIDIGVGQSITVTALVTRNGQPVPDAALAFTVDSDLVTIEPGGRDTGIPTDAKGIVQAKLTAGINVGTGSVIARVLAPTLSDPQTLFFTVWPVAEITDVARLRSNQDSSNTSSVREVASAGDEFILEGQNNRWWLVRLVDGRKLWLGGSAKQVRPSGATIPPVQLDAAVLDPLSLTSETSSPQSDEETREPISPGFHLLKLSEDDGNGVETVKILIQPPGDVLAELPEGVEVEILEDEGDSEFVPARVILWVPDDKATGTGSSQTLTNPSGSPKACAYRPGESLEDDDDKQCGSLMQIVSAIPFARDLTGSERSDENTYGTGAWKLAVIDVWVRRENIQ